MEMLVKIILVDQVCMAYNLPQKLAVGVLNITNSSYQRCTFPRLPQEQISSCHVFRTNSVSQNSLARFHVSLRKPENCVLHRAIVMLFRIVNRLQKSGALDVCVLHPRFAVRQYASLALELASQGA